MSFIVAYIQGWWQTIRKIKMWGLLYLMNIMFALVAVIPLSNLLKEKASRSMAIDKLLAGFDFAVVQDFINQYGDMLTVVLNQSIVLLILYLVFAVFFTGGILEVFKHKEKRLSLRVFWSGCSYYFWRLFRLTIYYLLIHGGVFVIFLFLFNMFIGGDIFELKNELEFYKVAKIVIPLYLLVAGVFFTIQDYAKVHIVHRDKGFFLRPFWETFSLVFKNFIPVFLLALLNLFTFAGFTFLYWLLSKPTLDSSSAITISFLIGQAFLFARIGTKLLNLASATILYKMIMVPEENIKPA